MINSKADSTTQKEIELSLNNNNKLKRIKYEFINNTYIIEISKNLNLDLNLLSKLLTDLVILRECPVASFVAKYAHNFSTPQECANYIQNLVKNNLIFYSEETTYISIKYDVTELVKQELVEFNFPLPIISKPKEIKHNNDSAYHTGNTNLVKNRIKEAHYDINIDFLNLINKTMFSINTKVSNNTKITWKIATKQQQSLVQLKSFMAYRTRVIDFLITWGNRFFLNHTYDSRGRVYPTGYHINPQGDEGSKAIIHFNNKELTNNNKY